MARIFPFRAIRYNTMDVAIADVVTQPYDKITPSMQQAYYARSPYNLVRVILGLPELFDIPGNNDVYTRAQRDFAEWRRKGILYREKEPCIYAYVQRFQLPGSASGSSTQTMERRGFIALGEVSDYSKGIVFRHEQTLAKPKSDRLNLLRATRAHFGQIFMLYSDPALTAERTLFGPNFRAEVELTDEYGVLHQIARVAEPNTINILAAAMADKKLIIADGHHRYETALAYSKERAPASLPHQERNLSNSLPQPNFPEAAVMMTFVNIDSEGLVILPTHRVVHGLKDWDEAAFLEKAAQLFTIRRLNGAGTDAQIQELAQAGSSGASFVAGTSSGRYLLTVRPEQATACLAALPERQRRLDVAQLQALILEKTLGITTEAIRNQEHLSYLRDANEAFSQVASGQANLALLLNPCSLDQLREVAFAGEVMPQKSTDFYPKLLSGLTIYDLD